MEVKITFDTEKESVEDLKKLISSLQDLVDKREKGEKLGNPITSDVKKPEDEKPQLREPQPSTPKDSPYEDTSHLLSKLATGGN